jgi:hypothetical protein
VTAQAGGTAGTAGPRDARADVAILVNVAAFVSEGTLTVQGAALTGNELASLLLGHVLVVGVVVVVAGEGHV